MNNVLPAIIWMLGALCAIIVCASCVWNSHYVGDRNRPVHPVSWTMVGAHVMSCVLFAIPYVLFLGSRDSMAAASRHTYEHLGRISAIVAVVLVFAQLTLMYLQARRAMYSQIDETLRKAI